MLWLLLIKTTCSGPHGDITGGVLSLIVHLGDSKANMDAGCLGLKAMPLGSQGDHLSSEGEKLPL